MNKDKYNSEGYKDLTAYYAIKNVEREEKHRVNRVLATIFNMVDLAGFQIEGRIVLRDKRNGKVYK